MNRMPKPLLVALTTLIAGAAQGAEASAVPPLPLPGPYAVACSNVAQDFNRLAPGEDVQLYWEGVPRANGTPRNADRPARGPGEHAVGNGQRAEQFRHLRHVRGARHSVRRRDLSPDDARRSAARLFVADRTGGAPHAARRRSAAVAGRDDALSGAALLARLRRKPAVQRLHHRVDGLRELRLRRRGAVSHGCQVLRPQARGHRRRSLPVHASRRISWRCRHCGRWR